MIEPGGIVERVRLGAYAWLESDDQVLVVRIAARNPAAGSWTLPGGGVRFGEDPEAALRREVLEETGFEILPAELLGVRSRVLEPHETPSGHRIHAVGLVYRASITGGALHSEAYGSSDLAAWVPVDEVGGLPDAGQIGWAWVMLGR